MPRQHGASFNFLKKPTHDQDHSSARHPARRLRRRSIRPNHAALGVPECGHSGNSGDARHPRNACNAREPDRRHGRIAGHTGDARYACNPGNAGTQGQRGGIGRVFHDEVTQ